jgi:hypothetical protein
VSASFLEGHLDAPPAHEPAHDLPHAALGIGAKQSHRREGLVLVLVVLVLVGAT